MKYTTNVMILNTCPNGESKTDISDTKVCSTESQSRSVTLHSSHASIYDILKLTHQTVPSFMVEKVYKEICSPNHPSVALFHSFQRQYIEVPQ